MILELDNVELYFKSKIILNSIYLKAQSGEVTSIFGRNGSGKSSLLRIIFGDLVPKYKLLRIDGKVINSALFKSEIAKFLPEYDVCPKHISLNYAFTKYKASWNDFKQSFPDFKPLKETKFKQLSTGERRLIEVFITLKSPGQIVLLDEPFKSLSPINVERIKAIIQNEKQDKVIITSDHTLDWWQDVSDVSYELKDRSLKLVS